MNTDAELPPLPDFAPVWQHIMTVDGTKRVAVYNALCDMLRAYARAAIASPAKGLTVQSDADGVWLAFAASTGRHALLNVDRIADSHGGIVSKALRDWAADVSASACQSGKCADPARDCYGSGCLSDEPQSAVAAAYGGLVQTPQG